MRCSYISLLAYRCDRGSTRIGLVDHSSLSLTLNLILALTLALALALTLTLTLALIKRQVYANTAS